MCISFSVSAFAAEVISDTSKEAINSNKISIALPDHITATFVNYNEVRVTDTVT